MRKFDPVPFSANNHGFYASVFLTKILILIMIGSFYPSGELISLHFLCYSLFAVEDCGFIDYASKLQRSKHVNILTVLVANSMR